MRTNFLLCVALLLPSWAHAAVDCNDANAVAETYTTPGTSTVTSYTRPSGSDFIGFAVAGHRIGANPRTLTAISWAGNAMTATTSLQFTDPVWGQLFQYLAPPPGAQNVTMNWNQAPLTDAIVIFTCTGVNQATPVHDAIQSTGLGTTASVTVSNVGSTDVVIACVTKDSTEAMTGGGSLVLIANDNATPSEMNVGCWRQPGSAGGAVSITWTGSQQWTIHAAAVSPVATAVEGDFVWFP